MSDVSRSGSAIVMPSNQYATQDYEAAKFTNTNGTVAVNITSVGAGGVSGYAEGGTVGTITGNAIVFRNSGGTMTTIQAGGSALPVTQDTLIAGEDLTNNVLKVEQRFSYAYCAGADTAIKSGEGFLHTLTFSQIDAAPTAGTIIVYDNTAESGTIIYSETFTTDVFRGYTVTIDASFSTGLYIGFTTIADIGVTVSYR